MATETEVLQVLKLLNAAYPNFQLAQGKDGEPGTVDVYVQLLADLPVDVLRAAVLQVATVNKFYPTVAEIREAAHGLYKHAAGVPTATDAWGEVVKAFGTFGYYRTPHFSHPLIDRTVQAMGWHSLCMTEEANIGVTRGQFLKMYQALVDREEQHARLLPESQAVVARLRAEHAAAALPAPAHELRVIGGRNGGGGKPKTLAELMVMAEQKAAERNGGRG